MEHTLDHEARILELEEMYKRQSKELAEAKAIIQQLEKKLLKANEYLQAEKEGKDEKFAELLEANDKIERLEKALEYATDRDNPLFRSLTDDDWEQLESEIKTIRTEANHGKSK